MFKKLSRGLAHKSGGKTPLKFRFDVQVVQLENLPSAVKNCRVVWSRGAKVQMTEFKNTLNGEHIYRLPRPRRADRQQPHEPQRPRRPGDFPLHAHANRHRLLRQQQ
jgi:hypothetical protein